jgi:hypothetical protein
MIGSLPTNSGMRPYEMRSECSTLARMSEAMRGALLLPDRPVSLARTWGCHTTCHKVTQQGVSDLGAITACVPAGTPVSALPPIPHCQTPEKPAPCFPTPVQVGRQTEHCKPRCCASPQGPNQLTTAQSRSLSSHWAHLAVQIYKSSAHNEQDVSGVHLHEAKA